MAKQNITNSRNLNIRTKNAERSLIDKAAEISNTTVSDFVLNAACRQAEEVIYDTRLFNLNDESFKKFVDELDASVGSNKVLKNLLERKPLWNQ